MESCRMKPEPKKKVKPPKLPPKPSETQRNTTENLDKPTPVLPPRPTHSELSQTQYRMKRIATDKEVDKNIIQSERKEKKPETPVPLPRLAEKEGNRPTRLSHRHSESSDDKKNSGGLAQSNISKDVQDSKESHHSGLTGMFRQSQKNKQPTFVSHVTEDQDRGDDTVTKQVPASKPGVLKGMMKHLKSTPKAGSGGEGGEVVPDPNKNEATSEKKQSADKAKQEKSAEAKQDFGGRLAGMFKKPPAVTVQQMDSESEEEDEKTSEQSHEKGGFFAGFLKKSNKAADEAPAQETSGVDSESLSSNDSCSENTDKKKGRLFKKKYADEDQVPLSGDLSDSSDNLSETSKGASEEKGGFFSAILGKKSPKLPKEATPEQEKGGAFGAMFKKSTRMTDVPNTEDPQDDKHSANEDGGSEENSKEKSGIFGGIFKKATKSAQLDEDETLRDKKLSASSENLSEGKADKDRGLFGGFLKKTPKERGERADSLDGEEDKEPTAVGSDDLVERNVTKDKNIFSNMFKKPQKPTEGAEADLNSETQKFGSSENLSEPVSKGKKGGFAGIFKRSGSIDNLLDEEKGALFSGLKKTPKASINDEAAGEKKSSSIDNLSETTNTKEKSIFSGMFKKSPKAAEEGAADEEANCEDKELSASNENLMEENAPKEKSGGFAGIFKKSPKPAPRSVTTKDPLSDTKETSDNLAGDMSGDELSDSNDNLLEAGTTIKEKKGGFAGMFKWTPKAAGKQQDNEEAEPPVGGGLKRRRTIRKKRRVVSFRVKTTLPRIPKLNVSSQADKKMPIIEESMELQEMTPAEDSTVEVQQVEMAAFPTEGNPLESEEENDGLLDWWKNVEGWAEWNEAANFQDDEDQMAMEEAADRVYMGARLFVHLFNQRGASLQHSILELLAVADAADQFHKKTVSAAVGGGVASVAGSLTTITGLILAPFTFGASIIVTAVGIGVATAGSITSATANITDTVHSNMDRKKVEKMIQGYQEQIKDIRECLEFVQEGMDTLQEWDFEKYSQSASKKALNHNIKHVMKEGGRAGKALMINTDKLISTVQVLGAAGGAAKAAQAISVTTGVMSALFLALDVFFLAKDSHELRKGAKTKFATKIRDVCKDLQDGLLELNKVKTQLQKTMDGIEVEEYEEIEEVEEEVDDDLESDPKKLAELEQELDLMEEKLDKKIEEEKKSKDWEKDKETRSTKGKEEEEEEKKEESGDKKKEGTKKKDKQDKETENRIAAWREKQETSLFKKTVDKPLEIKPPSRTEDSKRSANPEREQSHREDRGLTSSPTRRPDSGSTRTHGSERANQESGSAKNQGNMKDSRKKAVWESGVSDWRTETGSTDKMRGNQDRRDSSERELQAMREGHGKSDARRESHRSLKTSGSEHMDERISGSRRSHHGRVEDSGEERRGSRIESARRKFERGEEEEQRGKSQEERRRRGIDRERGGSERSHRGSRHHSSVLLDDGLYI
ncbi:uncharacterized protein LOC129177386 [Dunckerocampus dactyliophorus]|uniref:uncharacterized protein LOC129177386 n=1 Tax=Dunckerocampus dactyliophorus TaxID=161453 RepID=UPI0024063650|nr:uncharacterized protein LOC129177386 [Dunckerocampus dactyliophorus]